jgi:putative ABC transport system permease protein
MSSLISVSIVQSALEQGFIYALVALALYISFTTLNLCDLSTDGCFTLGCAVCAQVALTGHPFLALLSAMFIGVCSGFITAFLQTRLGVESILAGIIVNTGLYTVNLAVMGLGTKTGFSSTINMFQAVTVFDLAKEHLSGIFGSWYKLIVAAAIVLVIAFLLNQFFKTRLGLSIRATGDSPDMVRSSSINPAFTITVGLCLANALTGLAGGLLGQYQKSCDINLGTGMVTIALASLIIGQTLVGGRGKSNVARKIAGVILGSCLYRFIIALALRLNVDASCLKLVSAIIVAVAIAMPKIRQSAAFEKRKLAARAKARG